MLEKKLEEIYSKQLQTQLLLADHLLPEIDKLDKARPLNLALIKFQKKLIGTPFENLIPKIEELSENKQVNSTSVKSSLRHLFMYHQQKRLAEDAQDTDILIGSVPEAQLKPPALFFAAAIYNLQETLDAIKKSLYYAERALGEVKKNPQLELAPQIRQQYALVYDRLQLEQKPPQPQKYGTLYSPLNFELVPPVKNYKYNRDKIEQARQELKLEPLKELERRKKVQEALTQSLSPKLTLPLDKNKKQQEEQLLLTNKCPRCGRIGHSAIMCGYVPKMPNPNRV